MLEEILTPIYYIGGFLIVTLLLILLGYSINKYLTPMMSGIIANLITITSIIMTLVCMVGSISSKEDVDKYIYFGATIFFMVIYLATVGKAMKSLMK